MAGASRVCGGEQLKKICSPGNSGWKKVRCCSCVKWNLPGRIRQKIEDIRFVDYRKLDGGWIAARVEVHADNKLIFSEDYSEIQGNVKLDPGVFDPKQFNATHLEKQ